MGLKGGYSKETVQIVGVLKQSYEKSVGWEKGVIKLQYYIIYAGMAQMVSRLHTVWTVQGSNPGGGRDFPHPYRPAVGPTQPTVKWVVGLFLVGKMTGAWPWPPTHI